MLQIQRQKTRLTLYTILPKRLSTARHYPNIKFALFILPSSLLFPSDPQGRKDDVYINGFPAEPDEVVSSGRLNGEIGRALLFLAVFTPHPHPHDNLELHLEAISGIIYVSDSQPVTCEGSFAGTCN